MRLGAHSWWEGGVADDISKSLPEKRGFQRRDSREAMNVMSRAVSKGIGVRDLPFCLVLLKDLPLGVVSKDSDIDEAAQVELLGPELSHVSRRK